MTRLRSTGLLALVILISGAPGAAQPDDKPVASFDGHAAGVTTLTFSPDGKQIVSASAKDVRVWDAGTGKEVATIKVGGRTVALSADGKRVAVATREAVTVYDADGKELVSIKPHEVPKMRFPFPPTVSAMAFSPDGKQLATAASIAKVGGPHGYPGGVVKVWEVATGKELHRLNDLSTAPGTVTFSADGKLVAAGTNGAGGELPEPGEVWVWDAGTGKALQTLKVRKESQPGEFLSTADVALSPDGKRVAAAVGAGSRARPAGLLIDDKPSSILVWELASGRELRDVPAHKAWIGRVVFSPDGKLLASAGGDKTVRVWDAVTGKEVRAIPFDTARIDALAFSPDGKRLAAGGGDDKKPAGIKVWALSRD
jgi:WD40 repeat protein